MSTITVEQLKAILSKVPDDSPIYIVDPNGEGVITDVALHCENEGQFTKFIVMIDYRIG